MATPPKLAESDDDSEQSISLHQVEESERSISMEALEPKPDLKEKRKKFSRANFTSSSPSNRKMLPRRTKSTDGFSSIPRRKIPGRTFTPPKGTLMVGSISLSPNLQRSLSTAGTAGSTTPIRLPSKSDRRLKMRMASGFSSTRMLGKSDSIEPEELSKLLDDLLGDSKAQGSNIRRNVLEDSKAQRRAFAVKGSEMSIAGAADARKEFARSHSKSRLSRVHSLETKSEKKKLLRTHSRSRLTRVHSLEADIYPADSASLNGGNQRQMPKSPVIALKAIHRQTVTKSSTITIKRGELKRNKTAPAGIGKMAERSRAQDRAQYVLPSQKQKVRRSVSSGAVNEKTMSVLENQQSILPPGSNFGGSLFEWKKNRAIITAAAVEREKKAGDHLAEAKKDENGDRAQRKTKAQDKGNPVRRDGSSKKTSQCGDVPKQADKIDSTETVVSMSSLDKSGEKSQSSDAHVGQYNCRSEPQIMGRKKSTDRSDNSVMERPMNAGTTKDISVKRSKEMKTKKKRFVSSHKKKTAKSKARENQKNLNMSFSSFFDENSRGPFMNFELDCKVFEAEDEVPTNATELMEESVRIHEELQKLTRIDASGLVDVDSIEDDPIEIEEASEKQISVEMREKLQKLTPTFVYGDDTGTEGYLAESEEILDIPERAMRESVRMQEELQRLKTESLSNLSAVYEIQSEGAPVDLEEPLGDKTELAILESMRMEKGLTRIDHLGLAGADEIKNLDCSDTNDLFTNTGKLAMEESPRTEKELRGLRKSMAGSPLATDETAQLYLDSESLPVAQDTESDAIEPDEHFTDNAIEYLLSQMSESLINMQSDAARDSPIVVSSPPESNVAKKDEDSGTPSHLIIGEGLNRAEPSPADQQIFLQNIPHQRSSDGDVVNKDDDHDIITKPGHILVDPSENNNIIEGDGINSDSAKLSGCGHSFLYSSDEDSKGKNQHSRPKNIDIRRSFLASDSDGEIDKLGQTKLMNRRRSFLDSDSDSEDDNSDSSNDGAGKKRQSDGSAANESFRNASEASLKIGDVLNCSTSSSDSDVEPFSMPDLSCNRLADLSDFPALKRQRKKSIMPFNASCSALDFVHFTPKNFVQQKKERFEDFYELGQMLGEGEFGEVYIGYPRQGNGLGEERAIKIIDKERMCDSDYEQVMNEFELLKGLSHPNILTLYGFYEDKEKCYIVTDICKGGELWDELHVRGSFVEGDAAAFMTNVLSAVKFLQAHKIVHRDINLENILLEENKDLDQMKIIDFGLATTYEDGVKLTDLVGKVHYVPPEVLHMEYEGSKYDVWSCGVLCYIMLSGFAPFEGDNDREVREHVLIGNVDFRDPVWEVVSNEAKDFVRYLLTYEEDERPTAEQALKHPWIQTSIKAHHAEFIEVYGESSISCLENMEDFAKDASIKLQQVVYTYIASQLLRKEEREEINKVFRGMDADCDGVLSAEDIKQGYLHFFHKDVSDIEVENLFQRINVSETGSIDYTEFLIAAMQRSKIIDEEKLRAAFSCFDRGDKGYISANDLKLALSGVVALPEDDSGGMSADEIIEEMVKQVDMEGSGKISYQSFALMMTADENVLVESKTSPGVTGNEMGTSLKAVSFRDSEVSAPVLTPETRKER